MASSSPSCAINGCKNPPGSLCLCCQRYLCRSHLKEHDENINAQIFPLADQINELADQFNNADLLQTSCLADVDQWRRQAHNAVDQFCDRKSRELTRLVQERRDKQKQELDRMRLNMSELIQKQEATQEQVDSISAFIRSFEQDLNNRQHIDLNMAPLIIDDNFISIRQKPVQLTASNSSSVSNNGNNLLVSQKRNLSLPRKQDEHPKKSTKLSRWEIEEQHTGITDTMRVNILGVLNTAIDTYGHRDIQNVVKDVKNWLDETHGKHWVVKIVETRQYRPSDIDFGLNYFRVQETRLGWTIELYKTRRD